MNGGRGLAQLTARRHVDTARPHVRPIRPSRIWPGWRVVGFRRSTCRTSSHVSRPSDLHDNTSSDRQARGCRPSSTGSSSVAATRRWSVRSSYVMFVCPERPVSGLSSHAAVSPSCAASSQMCVVVDWESVRVIQRRVGSRAERDNAEKGRSSPLGWRSRATQRRAMDDRDVVYPFDQPTGSWADAALALPPLESCTPPRSPRTARCARTCSHSRARAAPCSPSAAASCTSPPRSGLRATRRAGRWPASSASACA